MDIAKEIARNHQDREQDQRHPCDLPNRFEHTPQDEDPNQQGCAGSSNIKDVLNGLGHTVFISGLNWRKRSLGDRVDLTLLDDIGYKIGAETVSQMAVIADAEDQ